MDPVYDTSVIRDTLGTSEHRMVIFQLLCNAKLDTGNIQRAVVRRFAVNERAALNSVQSPTVSRAPMRCVCASSGVSCVIIFQRVQHVFLESITIDGYFISFYVLFFYVSFE